MLPFPSNSCFDAIIQTPKKQLAAQFNLSQMKSQLWNDKVVYLVPVIRISEARSR